MVMGSASDVLFITYFCVDYNEQLEERRALLQFTVTLENQT